jgi:sulfur-oxidizing protein SoxY
MMRLLEILTVLLLLPHAAGTALAAEDPLKSAVWPDMERRFAGGAPVVFDERVRILAPKLAEDSMNVPVAVKIEGLPEVRRVVVIADFNPIVKVLEFQPAGASPSLSFRMKLQQASPVRALAQTADGTWHVGGVWIDAAGGGCTAPSTGRGSGGWAETLNQVHSRVWRQDGARRVRLRIMHPMDTGLAPGIPAFYLERLSLRDSGGKELMVLDLFEPVSENPVFSFDVPGSSADNLTLVGRDNNGNRVEASIR